MADFHSGHKNGLHEGNGQHWEYFAKEIDSLRPIDSCLFNGDAIEGKGSRSGGTELLTTDRYQQAKMAIEILKFVDAKQYIFTYGTTYHTGSDGEDWEDQIACHFKAPIGGQQFFSVNDVIIHAKHKISGSSIPHGRFTALARQKMWNLFWAERKQTPKADIFIRSHVHYFDYCGDRYYFATTTPALQGWGSKFGERDCEGTIDFGFIHFDILNPNEMGWKCHISPVESASVHNL